MVEKASEVMDSKSSSSQSEIGSAEDVVQALLDYLVAPMLPLKSAGREVPSLDQQQSVAKQVRAVVLLYNYYQRKRHSEVEFLGFESFCKLAVTLKPTLMGYLKLMQRSDYAELDDPEDQLSMTEKAIMDACDISLVLDASKDVPSTKGWPVSKVAVLLTDPSKEICVLKFGSIINGVWSIIEKDIDSASVISEAIGNGKHNKRKRNMKKPLRDETNADEAGFQRLALSSVSEVTGINQSDLMVLESHVVYSLSKEKTAAHFYIVQSTQSIREDLQVPIKDVLESLQGPLVRKSSCSWTVTPVVEYFHVLPYAGVLTDWFSRKVFSNSLQNLRVELGNEGVNSSQQIENLCDKEVTEDGDDSKKNCNAEDSVTNVANEINTESLEQRDINGSSMVCLSGSSAEPQNMDVDDLSVGCRQIENKSKSACNIIKVYQHQKRMTSSAESNVNAKPSGVKVDMVDSVMKPSEVKDEKADTGNKTCNILSSDQDELPIGDCAPVLSQLNSTYLEKLQVTLASKENALSQTALKVLLRKRHKLSRQLRSLEDEIAMCDKNIQTILDGSENDLALKIEAIIDACNDVCLKCETETQDATGQHFEAQGSPQYGRRKRLSEAVLTLQNSCQELDDICYENNWTLATYHVSPEDGGFRANVTVKGLDFECSGGSDMCSTPRLARDSAAAQMIVKLRNMASQSQ
ncbi:hypothetical protein LOK49_LG08G02075 [Camellia lanceoleosa]|uniref:Uncharacterized protein n=1 Tax=Camellia lanceoleosa TaxID=1840588 RepID=A0ACC0GQ69_9ERIC|nr:hypothetical protein LOK49_LG08G02075 [Camellia lanceoleosa]